VFEQKCLEDISVYETAHSCERRWIFAAIIFLNR